MVLSNLLASTNNGINKRVNHFNKVEEMIAYVVALGGKNTVFVDMHGDACPSAKDWLENGKHPDDRGYIKLAQDGDQKQSISSCYCQDHVIFDNDNTGPHCGTHLVCRVRWHGCHNV